MDRYARWNTLLEILAETGRITVEDAAKRLEVSQATIRRDFDQLSQQQMITRTRGGAVAGGISYDLPLRYKTAKNVEEKHRIGQAAAGLVGPGMVISLNGGTTITEVARALATRTDLVAAPGSTGLTVVTNALNIANELIVRPHLKVVVVGGVVRPQSYELIGPLAAPILREITLDIAFLGVDAVDVKLGATSHHEGEAAINALMAARARKIVVIADGSKIGGHAFARICSADRIHTLVTDYTAPRDHLREFEAVGIRVIQV
ncbi:DeoR/GlpR family DNA-binding transcription regulator [Natronoglycomyces albus]|uniref:DeoR/GlpR transcriptional regulator n=1 Tax=Natronoglycomyces albus TaxID=2811108 RepID=A0A895XJY8_9ACTN|nr:DeoR/GlpR family DNA-binding transcription regulator [Natronoglycomyces albus]QSB05654.1 DeoR/GlpR transcriptional regulator [Natronoglycomyces albus]